MKKYNCIIPPCSREDLERAAIKIIQTYQPDVLKGKQPFDIEDFVEFELCKRGIQFEVTRELPLEIIGLTDPSESKIWVHADLADDTSASGRRRYRSTLAHEACHGLYHIKPIQRAGKLQIFSQRKGETGTELYRKMDVPPYLNPEWQAWNFAGALLMPRPVVLSLIRDGANERELADHFEVNGAFVRRRLEKIKK